MATYCIQMDTTGKCKERAKFNIAGEKPNYCIKHKEENMIDVACNSCIYMFENNERCELRASYNFKNKKAIYCNTHKQSLMVNVSKKYCYVENCNERANYRQGENKKDYKWTCLKHREENYVDINYKKCQHKDENGKRICNKRAYYGVKKSKNPEYCINHKLKDNIAI